jgi:hydrogenase maturation protease
MITDWRPGCRVRLKPRSGADLLDSVLAGRTAVIERVEQDDRGGTHVVVALEDDPGRDLAATRHPAHRFFFTPEEIELLDESAGASGSKRVLVAGIGNIFFGDDGFGTAVAQRLAERELPPGVEVADFGIRGMDLAYALGQPYDAVILVDAVPHAGSPGRLRVMEPDLDSDETSAFDSHHMDPLAVLRLACQLGGLPPQILLVGCESMEFGAGASMSLHLSAPVAAAVEPAADTVLELAHRLLAGHRPQRSGATESEPPAKKGDRQ